MKFFLLTLFVCFLIIPCAVQAETLDLFDKMPTSSNGENSIHLQSRIDNQYTDLTYLPDHGDSWFGTPDSYRVKPFIAKGPFPDGKQYDTLAIYSFPSAITQTGFKADTVIRVTIPGNGGYVDISGQTGLEGKSKVSRYRFYIYKGEGRYNNPLWESVGGGNFAFTEPYSANDQIFFAVEALDSDDQLGPKWKYVTLETSAEKSTTTATTIRASSSPSPASSGSLQSQGTSSSDIPIFPLAGALLVIILIAGCVLYYQKKRASRDQRSGTPGSGMQSGGSVSHDSTKHHDVFISHSSKDKTIGDAVCAGLEAKGIRCWIAPRDVMPGTNFQESIIDAIDTSDVMVLIYSANSNDSPHVTRELTRAVSEKVIIIPFRIDDSPLSKSMQYLISVPHWLDAITPPLQHHIDELANTIRLFLEQKKG